MDIEGLKSTWQQNFNLFEKSSTNRNENETKNVASRKYFANCAKKKQKQKQNNFKVFNLKKDKK